jgi:hypothetical protein
MERFEEVLHELVSIVALLPQIRFDRRFGCYGLLR